jgi:hypothetical protein
MKFAQYDDSVSAIRRSSSVNGRFDIAEGVHHVGALPTCGKAPYFSTSGPGSG